MQQFIKFIINSPSSYHAIDNVKRIIKSNKNISKDIVKGYTYIKTRVCNDGKSLIAVSVGKNVNKDSKINLVVAHADSPWYKVTSLNCLTKEGFNYIPTTIYGGPILTTWYDRPITLAGRVKIKKNNKNIYKKVYLKDETMMITNSCIHFKKFIDNQDMIINGNPLIGSSSSLIDILSRSLHINKEDILDINLNTISKLKPVLWGDNKEYLSSERLDDLACVYTSLIGFINTNNDDSINILYISDNEEIGSKTYTGADSNFLNTIVNKICNKLEITKDNFIKNCYLISADNAQAVNPYYDYLYNPSYKIYLNKGVGLKFSDKYCTTKESSKIFIKMCEDNNLEYQIYYNRDDIPGGGTVGKIIQKHIPINGVDIGIPQLSMHSSFETMGSYDLDKAIKLFEVFFKR